MKRTMIGLVALLAAAWLGGFFWFVADLGPMAPPPDTKTDAIVVLTGGSERIESGLALLTEGKARKLFVSGVHPGVEAADLTHGSVASQQLITCCLVLGHDAVDTVGNAAETAVWLNAERYHSLRLVTANYHMRRAMLEFRRALPTGTVIIADPVIPSLTHRDGTSSWRATARVVIVEYMKYLAALARPLINRTPGHAST